MQVSINFLHVDENDVSSVLNAIRHNYAEVIDSPNKEIDVSVNGVVVFECLLSFEEFEEQIRKALESYDSGKYIVTVDLENFNTITILKPNNLEQLGIYICDFCGTSSSSEEEKYIHERAHYFY